MAHHESHDTPPPPAEPKLVAVLGQFAGPGPLLEGVRKLRAAGYTKLEAYSPFPVHGIDQALGAKKPILPWVVLAAGLTGGAIALAIQYYMNATEGPYPFSGYKYLISDKPFFSLPANIPVTFELIIAFSAFTAFFGMLAFNLLPRFYTPLHNVKRFLKATDNAFFLTVDARDPKLADGPQGAAAALTAAGATAVEECHDTPPAPIPGLFHLIAITLGIVGLVPLAMIAMSRGGTHEKPRLVIWWDMDWQPKLKTQKLVKSEVIRQSFRDGRSMRLPVPGTVARGRLELDPRLYYGIEPDAATEQVTYPTNYQPAEGESAEPATEAAPAEAAAPPATDAPAADPAAAAAPPAAPEPNWVTEFPLPVTNELMDRGRERYGIHCAVCHGLAGDGDGLVAQRAALLEQGTWVPPSSLHTETVGPQSVGKLFNTVSNGIRNMPGYREHISVEDRWAIVLYVKALQRQRSVPASVLSADELAKLTPKK